MKTKQILELVIRDFQNDWECEDEKDEGLDYYADLIDEKKDGVIQNLFYEIKLLKEMLRDIEDTYSDVIEFEDWQKELFKTK
jgi:hypothetical protein